MLETKEAYKDLTIDFELNDQQRAVMSSAIKQEWFDILQKIMEQEIREMNLRLMNTPTENHAEVLGRHSIAQAAGMFYSGVMKRLEEAVALSYIQAAGIGTKQNPEEIPLLPEFE